ncbi:MAG: Mini-ribonuclease 3 [Firmicutes bacterium]|nr:Mini-ribonuclease 3 [Bacillota bacterium]
MTDYQHLSPEVWAYLGDAVFELLVRQYFVLNCPCKAGELHKRTTAVVNAEAQARMVRRLQPYLTESEWEIVKKGRNISVRHGPRSGSVHEYRYSTGLEALFGLLFLQGDLARAAELLDIGLRGNEHNGCADLNDD